MFAFALWDNRNKCLFLARDRIGEKPLYYGLNQGVLLFGSELKALRKYPDFQAEIDRDVLSLYFQHNYIPSNYSIYQGIYKLPPATLLKITYLDVYNNRLTEPCSYWSLNKVHHMAKPICSRAAKKMLLWNWKGYSKTQFQDK